MATILFTAGFVTIVFKKIGQPVVLGYLAAGFLLSPEVSFLPNVQEREAIQIWAEIGVIFLLFSLGLEFSFKKLMAVGRGASITAVTEVLIMLALGFLTGQAFGWSAMDSLFLGGILSISSTTIIIRAFDELGLRQKAFAQLVFGVLIVEDLVAILLLVLLSTIAVTHAFAGYELFASAAKLVFFLSIWFLGGIFIVPAFLKRVRGAMNEETSLIVALGLCLGMVLLATQAGFSPALGAFIMGSIIAETPDGEKIEHVLTSVKNLFSAIFFVSVGMLIQIAPMKEHGWAILTITLVTLFGKIISTTIGALLGGQSIKTSVKSGFSLAQIGEFSFIIATLGLTLNVVSDFLYPIAVTVSAITTLTTPYLIRSSEPFYNWLMKRLPANLMNRASNDVQSQMITANASSNQKEVLRLIFNTSIVIAVGLFSKLWLSTFLTAHINHPTLVSVICLVFALGFSLPSFWAIVYGSGFKGLAGYTLQDIRALTSSAILTYAARILISLFLLAFIIAQFVSALFSFFIVANLTIMIGFLGSKNFSIIYQSLENQFLKQLNEKDRNNKKALAQSPALAPWDAHLTKLEVHPDSIYVGRKILEAGIREKYGITITMIERGQKQILAPRADEILMPFDKIIVLGTDEQLSKLAELLSKPEITDKNALANEKSRVELSLVVLNDEHSWIGKSIRESGIREKTMGLVVGIERSGQRILNPDVQTIFQSGDHVWLVCDSDRLKEAPVI